ncbi:EAL domain-containing protein [Roseomonas nepalensis]|uniref:EAL domain-containing protein n=1 Tax=Muricoccus nepalensis TaxID=1854500 RepID=A0A502GC57_9PROT|nr:EAL domain-containing protein [Roseomonas nepalensis]TPG59679.1 EAL domain-containing protein [Roseomonas nepalensis]
MLSLVAAALKWPESARRRGPGPATPVEADDRRAAFHRAAIGALLAAAIGLATAGYLGNQREAALRDAEREVRNLSLVLATWIGDGFRTIEQLEAGIADWMRAEGVDDPAEFYPRLSTRAVHEMLRGRVAALPRVSRFFLVDHDGRNTANTASFPAPSINSIGRDYFDALRNDSAPDTFLSAPSRNQVDGQWSIFLARRLHAPDGRFLGVVAAGIDLNYFEGIFGRLTLGPGSSVQLARRDGLLLAGHPWPESLIGTSMAGDEVFTALLPRAGDGTMRSAGGADGEARVLAARALDSHPLVVVASRATDQILAPWRSEARRLGAGAAVLDTLILAGVLLVNRQARQRAAVRRLQDAQREAEARAGAAEAQARDARLLAAREASLRAIFDNGTAGIAEVDATTRRFLRVNRRYAEITGRSEAELLGGLGPMDVVHPDARERIRGTWEAARDRDNWEMEARYLRPDGTMVWARLSVAVVARDAAGAPVRLVSIVQDVTERHEAEALLRLSLEVGRIGSFRHDIAAGTVASGPEMCAMLGLPAVERLLTEEQWFAPVLPEDAEGLRAAIDRGVAAREAEGAVEYRIRRASDGEVRHVEARVRLEYDGEGRPLSAVGAVIDVTERREAEARIAHLAHHDALTGLPNRLLLRERLDAALARARRGEGFAVVCLDLDRFKEVNDSLGHPVGDSLLRAVTERLKAAVRGTDTLARLGGDEFAIVLADVDQPAEATSLARRLVEVVGQPFEVDGHQVVIGTSIGIAVAPGDGLDADVLLKAADMALYCAKADGRGRWRFFEPEMDARMQMRRALETDLRHALAMGEFEVHYQPIIGVGSRRVSGLEALVRWRHPVRGLVPPDAFIPLCEEIGLIVPLGEWVLAQACAEAVTWRGAPKVAVNLSAVQFANRGLVEAVAAALEASGLAPGRLELEITETVMLQDTESTLATLHRLKALGVRIALDDFGTGYSSLSYLQRFPFDKVKIDRCFTRGLDHSRQSEVIVSAVTGLCAGLDMTTTAEGVETEEQFRALARNGCTEAQGYLFSRPCLATEVPATLARLNAAAAGQVRAAPAPA